MRYDRNGHGSPPGLVLSLGLLRPWVRGVWHAYRRKWATERKHLPLKDVAAAGGWVDVETLLRSYQQPDKGTLLAVMSEPRKLSEIMSAGQ